MLNRRTFLATTTASLCVPTVHSSAQERTRELRIGLAADAQYADADPNQKRHYREGDNRLADAVAEFNRQSVDCCFHLGDLIDRDFASFDRCFQSLKELTVPCHHVLGNHDFDVAADKKRQVPQRIGLQQPYYARTLDKIRFLMLDGTENSTYAYPDDDPRQAAAQQQLTELQQTNAPNAQSWNGGIGPQQLEWLESELTSAAEADERAVLMCHYPLFPANAHNLWNDRQLLSIIDEHPCVVAWFNGHNHAGHYGERNGVHYVTLNGMVEDAKTNAFGVAIISSDRISLTGFGRQPSRQLKFRPA